VNCKINIILQKVNAEKLKQQSIFREFEANMF